MGNQESKLEAAANRFHAEIQVPDRCDPDEVTKFRHPVESPVGISFGRAFHSRLGRAAIVSSFALKLIPSKIFGVRLRKQKKNVCSIALESTIVETYNLSAEGRHH